MAFGQYGAFGEGAFGVSGVSAPEVTPPAEAVFASRSFARNGRARAGTHLLTPPTAEPVTLAEMKAHERIDHDAEDDLIVALISAAREQCEHLTGRSLMPQTWQKTIDCFPGWDDIELLHPMVNKVVGVFYVDAVTGQEVELNASQYVLDNKTDREAWLQPARGVKWPATDDVSNAVRIVYEAGYANADAVPMALKAWIKMAVGTWYVKREGVVVDKVVSKLPREFYSALLDRYRVYQGL